MKYQSRGNRGGGGGAGGGYITLYMPESMPQITNANNWEQFSYGAGPIGALVEDGVDELMRGVNTITSGDMSKNIRKEDIEKGIDRIRNKFDNLVDNAGPLGKQAALMGVGRALGATANHVMSVREGNIYNPNIELAYTGPGMREFSFSFKMVPKSAGEAATINNIIREFKRWSSPEVIGGGMYRIPDVWQVTYMSGGGANAFQNQFMPAALTNIVVTDNQGLGYYSAHEGGAPIVTSMALSFKEIDVITRDMHSGPRGM